MPELPEVEVVRAGLAPAITGARVVSVAVEDHRALKRHISLGDSGGTGHGVTMSPEVGAARAADFERRLTGAVLGAPARRGKFLWVPLTISEFRARDIGGGADDGDIPVPYALLAHLGMSGQMLLRAHEAPDDRHVRIRLWLEHPEHGELRVDFADQRLFGSLAIDRLEATADGAAGGAGTDLALMPGQASHIARDPLDPAFDDAAFVEALRKRSAGVKTALLDQKLVSGVGNIYADEALWRARLHPETPGARISASKAVEVLARAREVFAQALAEGGTSFDEQYVNVNGEAGYFAHALNAYGRTDQACYRCGSPIRRVKFMNRSSFFCPQCQRKRSS